MQEDLTGKVVVLGLDGGTWTILRNLAHAGTLPNLARAMQQSAHGQLESCTPPYSAPGWTTITTGLNPGRHGIFDFYTYKDGRASPVSVQSTPAPRVWDIASAAGKQVHIFNIPVTYPPAKVNGTFVTGLLTPSVDSEFTHPPELKQELLSMPGGYHPDPSSLDPMWGEALSHSEFWIRQKEKAFRQLLSRRPWDLAFSVIQETDPLQHKFWFLMDETDPRYDRELARRYRPGIERVYRACDDAIGERLKLADRGATFLLISDHGFGRYEKLFHINRVLEDAGLLARAKSARRHIPLGPMQVVRALRRLDRFGLESRLPATVRGKAMSTLNAALAAPIDWSRTVAFAGPSSAECVFVKGTSQSRELVRQRAIDALRAARDPDSGEPIVESVYRREDLYHGDRVSWLPEIVLDFGNNPYLGSDRLISGGITEDITPTSGGGRHRKSGILVVAGPEVTPGPVEGARIADIFPTVVHCLGLPVPEGLDGDVLRCASKREVVYTSGGYDSSFDQPAGPGADVYSADDEAAIEASLRSLGYLD